MKTVGVMLCLLVAHTCVADTAIPDNVVLNPGDKVPFQGILMPLPRAEKFRLIDIDLQTCQKVSSLKDEETAVLTARINNANAENNMLSERLVKTKETGFWSNVGMFILGAATTLGLSYVAAKAYR